MEGYDKLWNWFGCSRSSWITLPRTMAHEMPDDWQAKLADLLEEWDETWDSSEMPSPIVLARNKSSFCKWPSWLLNYRRPNSEAINSIRRTSKL